MLRTISNQISGGLWLLILLVAIVCAMGNHRVAIAADATPSGAAKAALPLVIYSDGNGNSGYIPSGWMGDTGNIHYKGHCTTANPPKGTNCIRIKYASGTGWGGIVWQNPANNWGDAQGGFDLTGAKTLSFWAKAKHAGLKVTFGFGVIGAGKTYSDSSKGSRKITLTTKWKKYTIRLKGKDLTRIVTGFFFSAGAPGKPFTFYLDNIEYK